MGRGREGGRKNLERKRAFCVWVSEWTVDEWMDWMDIH